MDPGFEIAGTFYPMPDRYRICDPIVVREVTGCEWERFTELLEDNDPACLPGLIAVAVWQKHPKWKRDRVVSFVENVSFEDLSVVGEQADDDAVPPTEDGTDTSPEPSRDESDVQESSVAGSPVTSGAP